MFINALKKQNIKLVKATLLLHQQKKLLPDSYVIDVDQFTNNARQIKDVADKHGVKLYGMSKQFGRNPVLSEILISLGYEGIVAVDYKEARTLHQHGVNVAHIGHLVQPPLAMLDHILTEIKPEVVTIYTLEKAKQLSERAAFHGVTQAVLVKFYDDEDLLYVNQESGFHISEMPSVLQKIRKLGNIRIEGITHFPCFLYDGERTNTTPNMQTLLNVKDKWPADLPLTQVNMPSSTNSETLPIIAKLGGTHGEPGHALTGTCPSNVDASQPEKIAMLYLSEVSHTFGEHSYIFSGGYYRRGHLENALINDSLVGVSNDDPSSIDYHLKLQGIHQVGTPVIMAFRTQIFVTRSDVVLVRGIQSGMPHIIGTFNSLGDPIHV